MKNRIASYRTDAGLETFEVVWDGYQDRVNSDGLHLSSGGPCAPQSGLHPHGLTRGDSIGLSNIINSGSSQQVRGHPKGRRTS